MITRSVMTEISKLIDAKFDEFKKSLLTDLKAEIDKVLVDGKQEISRMLQTMKDEVNAVALDLEKNESIIQIRRHVKELLDNDLRLREENKCLRLELDDL